MWDEKSDSSASRQLLYRESTVNFLENGYFRIPNVSAVPIGYERKRISFDPRRCIVDISEETKKICTDVFDTAKKIHEDPECKQKFGEKGLRRPESLLCASLFEALAGYWEQILLSQNLDLLGVNFWRQILDITQNWQSDNDNFFIHKGTPYYFLAENYFLLGDIDSAFTYLHNALKIDEQTWQWEQEGHIGAYSLAKMINDRRTQMNYVTLGLQKELEFFIKKFNENYYDISLDEIENKFLKNENQYHILGYFFTFTFHTIVHNKKNVKLETHENYFSKIRNLDIIFNICLISDKILYHCYLTNSLPDEKYISNGIQEYFLQNYSFDYIRLYNDWKHQRKFDQADPDKTIRMLLTKQERYGNQTLRKDVYPMMLLHYCRNLGAHSLNEKNIFVTNYDDILEELMMALFLCIKSINN